MKFRKLTGILAGTALLTGIALAAGAVQAGEESRTGLRGEHTRRMHHPSLGHMIQHNAMVKELTARSGRPASEVEAMFREGGPRAATEALGLDRDAMKASMQSARKSAIDQAQQAQLITAEQAQALLDAPPRHGKHGRPDDDDAPGES